MKSALSFAIAMLATMAGPGLYQPKAALCTAEVRTRGPRRSEQSARLKAKMRGR